MRHVLLVYDDQEDPGVRKLYLESVGYMVTLCSSSTECLRHIDTDRPDVVVMDILIKGQNGFETCRRIRHRFSLSDLPVILCSSIYRKRIYREEAWDAGAQGFLLKPIEPEKLVQHIESLTNRGAREVAQSEE